MLKLLKSTQQRTQAKLLVIYENITKLVLKFFNLDPVHGAYESLSPTDNAENNKHYAHALRWALKNRKKNGIRNIALTGPYGSGKSSVIKTFLARHKVRRLKYLNISLATFNVNENITPEQKAETLRLIELSILQQIFFHEKDSKIPDSRFKKIKSFNIWQVLAATLGVFTFFAGLLNYFYPAFLIGMLREVKFTDTIRNIIDYTTYSILVVGTFLIILKSIRAISVFTISKLKISDTEIELDSRNKSILNSHIDEILYFFEVTKYKVVFIEDLDRFQDTEIFTKLREINQLLNNSKKTRNLRVVFVYAVKDEMFKDKTRTKFFDFIIPVIPVINSSNSANIFISKRNKLTYPISDNFIQDVSVHVDDMRLLYNVMNEFHLSREMLGTDLNPDKMLAMMLYKNLLPADFASLAKSEGALYRCLASKNQYIITELERIDGLIKPRKASLETLTDLRLTNINELRKLYILEIVQGVERFHSFMINGQHVAIANATSDENFEYFLKDKASYYSWNSGNSSIGRSFRDVEKQVSSKSYQTRKQEIDDFNAKKVNALRLEIQQLEEQKILARNAKLMHILQNGDLDVLLESALSPPPSANPEETEERSKVKDGLRSNDKKLIRMLLRNGYIDEEYLYYITIFYEGMLTRKDNDFLIAVKEQGKLPFDYHLDRIANLIEKMSLLDFQREQVLNYDLMNFMINKGVYTHQLGYVYATLKNQTEVSVDFIEGFLAITPHEKAFFQGLVAVWRNMWEHMKSLSQLTDERKRYYLKGILEHGSIDDILKLSERQNLNNDILADKLFLTLLPDPNRTKKIFDELMLDFRQIDFAQSPTELLDYLYQNNYYEINPFMVGGFLAMKGKFDRTLFEMQNYHAIQLSGCSELIEYVENNIDDYIANLYLKIDSNKNDPAERVIQLLNHENISVENKIAIVRNTGIKLEKIDSIGESMWDAMFEHNKIVATWPNMLRYFEFAKGEFSSQALIFLNNEENAKMLSASKMPKDQDENKKHIYSPMCKKLLETIKLTDHAFALLCTSSPWCYSDLELSAHGDKKIQSLFKNFLICTTKTAFDYLKSTFKTQNYHIKLLELRKETFFEKLAEFQLTGNDVLAILKSSGFMPVEKAKVVQEVHETVVINDLENLTVMAALLKKNKTFTVNDTLFNKIITHANIPLTDRIELYNSHDHQIGTAELISEFLNSLAAPYANLTANQEKIEIPHSEINKVLLERLKTKSYIVDYEIKKDKLLAKKVVLI